jgi:hypothetical protein
MGIWSAESSNQSSADQDKAWRESDKSDRLARIAASMARENSAASSRNARRGI